MNAILSCHRSSHSKSKKSNACQKDGRQFTRSGYIQIVCCLLCQSILASQNPFGQRSPPEFPVNQMMAPYRQLSHKSRSLIQFSNRIMEPVAWKIPGTDILADPTGTSDTVPIAAAFVAIKAPYPDPPNYFFTPLRNCSGRTFIGTYFTFFTKILQTEIHQLIDTQQHGRGDHSLPEVISEFFRNHMTGAPLLADAGIHKGRYDQNG